MELIELLLDMGSAPPHVYPTETGGLSFEWDHSSLEFRLREDGIADYCGVCTAWEDENDLVLTCALDETLAWIATVIYVGQ